jgi:hypothetical protein
LSRQATSFVLGYHGCERDVGLQALAGRTQILQSDRDFDWLGPGAYFWEGDPRRALEWAKDKPGKAYAEPFVVGPIIDLGNCLDLTYRENMPFLHMAHRALEENLAASGTPMPVNRNPKDTSGDKALRKLDCAVIRQLHRIIERQPDGGLPGLGQVLPFDSVRGMFREGQPVYPGGEFFEKSHTQIAVRSSFRIKGVFLPPEFYPQD